MIPPELRQPCATLPCEGKHRFASKADGLSVFMRIKGAGRFRNAVKRTTHVYRCTHCNQFHIGSEPRKTKRRKSR
jgi:ribosomal protein L44E